MSLKEEIFAASEKEIEEIISSARKNAETLRHNARVKAEQSFCKAQNHTERQNDRTVRILQSEAEMKCRLEAGQALEELLLQLKEKITVILEQYWRTRFAELVTEAVISGAGKMRSDEIAIELPETFSQLFFENKEQIRSALAERKISIISASFTLHAVCGVVITGRNGRKMVTDTAEENIRRIEDELRMTLAERIGYGG